MNQCFRFLVLMLVLIMVTTFAAIGQEFKIKLTFTGVTGSDTLWLGMSPYNTNCLDEPRMELPVAWWEYTAPPLPPLENLRAKFLDHPSCPPTPNGLRPYDFRLYPSGAHVDTFWIRVQGTDIEENGSLTISWPSDLCLYGNHWILKKAGTGVPPPIDMCLNDSYTDSNPTGAYQLTYMVIRTDNMPPCGLSFSRGGCSICYSINLGQIPIGETQTFVIGAANSCPTNTFVISSITAPSSYGVTPPPPVMMAPLSSLDFSFSYTPTSLGFITDTIVFHHNATGGTTMFTVTGFVYDPAATTLLSINSGWNLASVPRVQSDYTANVVFQGSYGSLFKYDPTVGDYAEAPLLELGWGYWTYYQGLGILSIIGSKPCPIIIHCKAGWNLIGSCPSTIAVGDITLSNGSIFGSAFKYDPTVGDYVETAVILPGQGTWIYLTEECDLTLPCECE